MTTTANRSYRWLFWTLAVVGFCLDQGSKYGVFAYLYNYPPNARGDREVAVITDVFYLAASFTNETDSGGTWRSPLRTISAPVLPEVNPGALWGIGGRDAKGYDLNHIFALVSVTAAVAIMIWSSRPAAAHDRWLCLALGLILAGTLGNLYDRVVFFGVRDFLQWYYLFNFPRFNIADSCLVCGASVLLVQAFFASPKEKAVSSQLSAISQTETCVADR